MPKRTALVGKHGSRPGPADSRKVFQAFLVRISADSNLLKPGSKSGLSPLGKLALHAWVDFETEGVKSDTVVFRPNELEGILLVSGSDVPIRQLGHMVRLFKARVTKFAEKEKLPPVPWRKAYAARALTDVREITSARRRLEQESKGRTGNTA